MRKALLVAALSAQFTSQLFAGGDISPVETHHPENMVHHEESKYYVIVKALMVMGNKVDHGHSVLDGDKDYGYGLDLGYRFGNGFALEYDFSYARNTVSEIEDGHVIHEAKGIYYTHALDIVYTYEFTHTFGVFAKAGYEYEIEKIEDFNIDNDGTGFNFGVGVEVALNHKYKVLAEYEHATIEGPRGDSVFVGLMYNF